MGRKKAHSKPANRRRSATPEQLWQEAVEAFRRDDLERARRAVTPLLDEPSASGQVYLLAGMIETGSSNWQRARPLLLKATQLQSHRIEGWLTLGNTHYMLGEYKQAIAAYGKAVKLQPGNPLTHNNVGVALADAGQLPESLTHFDRALALDPDYRDALTGRADVLRRLGRTEEALAAHRVLCRRYPDDFHLRVEYAEALEMANRPHEAAAELPDHELLQEPKTIAYAGAVHARLLLRDGDAEGALDAAKEARSRSGFDWLGYHEGRALDRLERPEAAIESFKAANAARAAEPRVRRAMAHDAYAAQLDDWLAAAEACTDAGALDNADADGEPPVFLVGLPRSGTTLLDRMLGAHPALQVLEEVSAINAAEYALGRGGDRTVAIAKYREFVELHTAPCSTGRWLDKNPLNTPRVATIARLFPTAPVIWILRHPYDAALSCYMQDFTPNRATTCFLDLETSARVCAQYLRIMRAFERARPGQVVRVRYEDLVRDYRAEVERVLAALGLAWHDDIAGYGERAAASGLINSASYQQVTAALHTGAIERWRRYRPWLGVFDASLGAEAEALGYAI